MNENPKRGIIHHSANLIRFADFVSMIYVSGNLRYVFEFVPCIKSYIIYRYFGFVLNICIFFQWIVHLKIIGDNNLIEFIEEILWKTAQSIETILFSVKFDYDGKWNFPTQWILLCFKAIKIASLCKGFD